MKRISLTLAGLLFFVFFFTGIDVWAADSVDIINYQGKLTDSAGRPMADGAYSAKFAIFDTATPTSGQNALWYSARDLDVMISGGVFNVKLGAESPFPQGLFDQHDNLYLKITWEDEDLEPLQHLTSVPYAMKADFATTAASVLDGTITGDLYVNGNMGIGTNIPESLLHLSSTGGVDLILEADTDNNGGEEPARVLFRQDGGAVNARMGFRDGENNLEIIQEYNDLLIFGTNNKDRLIINGEGHIQINSDVASGPILKFRNLYSPSYPTNKTLGRVNFLDHLAKVKGSMYYFHHGLLGEGDSTGLYLATEGSPRMMVSWDGKVGIGTTNPDHQLEINGDMEINGNGGNFPAGFLFLRNDLKDTGIRLYNGDNVKHHIYNDTDALYANSLRIVPEDAPEGGITITQGGFVGIGTGTTAMSHHLTVRGKLGVRSLDQDNHLVAEIGEGLDYAEGFNVTEQKLEPGTVLAIDPANPGNLTQSKTAYDRKVAGIVAGANGLGSGVRIGAQKFDNDVALAGRVYCKVDATEKGILSGDLLTTASTPGYAMKVSDYGHAQGAILGKAMEPLQKGNKGLILVLVTLQ